MGEVALTVENVSKRFSLRRDKPSHLKERVVSGSRGQSEEFWALRDVSLEVPKGSMYGVIGHNGSGKSTLLKLMANIHRPTGGRIAATGRLSALLELGTGFHAELTGRENIYLNASILGIGRNEIDQKIDEIIEFSGIGEFVESPVKIYSSGMKVRLGFSVAVHVDPEILLLDEVVAVGDERFKRKCFEHLYTLRKRGVTIVLVTHNMGQVQNMCDEATLLVEGEVKAQGEGVDVANRYLQEVNAGEGARQGLTGGAGAEERGKRRGSGEIEITKVSFMNDRAKVTPFANAGRSLVVQVEYRAHEPVQNPVFGVKFHNDAGTVLAAPNMRVTGYEPGVVEGEGMFVYRIPRMHLTPGTYHLTAGVYDAHLLHVYDERLREFELRVQPGLIKSNVDGVFDFGGDWGTHGDKARRRAEGGDSETPPAED